LSSLHAPVPPQAAKLESEGRLADNATKEKGPSLSESMLKEQEEIVKLNVCGHIFHMECLMSWYVFGKFSCPVCRAVYYGKPRDTKKSGESGRTSVATGRGSSGMTVSAGQ
jgi:hypothetical protein